MDQGTASILRAVRGYQQQSVILRYLIFLLFSKLSIIRIIPGAMQALQLMEIGWTDARDCKLVEICVLSSGNVTFPMNGSCDIQLILISGHGLQIYHSYPDESQQMCRINGGLVCSGHGRTYLWTWFRDSFNTSSCHSCKVSFTHIQLWKTLDSD